MVKELDLIELLHSRPVARARYLAAEVLLRYFRLRATGVKHVPRHGRAIVLPNHSGFAGFDVIVLAHYLRKTLKRSPKILAHRAYFDVFQSVRVLAEAFGLTEPKLADAQSQLEHEELLLLFPEAEAGNFKSSFSRYRLRHFHAGFVRLAITTGAPVVPCLIVGAEESNFNLGNVDLSRFVRHLVIPLPVNLLPFPAKWTMEFLPPVDLSMHDPKKAEDHEFVAHIAEGIRRDMQAALDKLLAKRKYVYFP